jgi:hypothetical protein
MRDELLNEMLFLSLDHARIVIAAWAQDYNQERPHSSLGYNTPAAFAGELDKQCRRALIRAGRNKRVTSLQIDEANQRLRSFVGSARPSDSRIASCDDESPHCAAAKSFFSSLLALCSN